MDGFDLLQYLSENALTISLASTRIAIIFIILPLFTSELVPALVRNAIFLSMAIMVVVIQPSLELAELHTAAWLILFIKEAVVGLTIGVLFGVYLWAFETAGQIIDNQIGTSIAQVQDPLTGSQTTLIGSFLARLANYIFVTAGGLLLLNGVLFESYLIWPIETGLPDLKSAGVSVLGSEFYYYFKLTLLIASPMLVVILMIDSIMGLVNRYAQQFNVFFLSMSLKMLAAIVVLFITITSLIQLLITELHKHADEAPSILQQLYGG
ncbi:MAG: type III secretion system export apparatus subunit SctT [Candidatus Thiodiazotropha taylori]|nr:type III secretion system export apparatus subunit SctT [Candidatus Thiodiazotropha taylori]MCW4244671.1 type III secretion system export apparatus subunit SctT [Candidatus Thiodiazotropha taylori]